EQVVVAGPHVTLTQKSYLLHSALEIALIAARLGLQPRDLCTQLVLGTAVGSRENEDREEREQPDTQRHERHRIAFGPLPDPNDKVRGASLRRSSFGGAAEFVGHFAGAEITTARMLGQAAANHRVDIGGDALAKARDRQRIDRLDLLQRRRRRAALERGLSR